MMQKSLAIIFTLMVVWIMVTPLWRSGISDQQGNLLFDAGATFYDAGVHLSLIGEMQNRFPPTNFAYGGVPLKNYHYIYDALLAGVVRVTDVSYLDLYYRYAPVVLSIFLSLVIYKTTLVLTKNHWAAAFAIFFSVFGTSLGVFTLRGTNNVFMTDQIYDMMVNPQGVLSLVIFLSLFLLLSAYEESKKRLWLVLFSLLLAVSFGIKAHGGVIFAVGSVFCIIWLACITRNYFAALIIALGLGGIGVWILTNLDGSAVGIRFAPFWLLDRLVGDYERLYQTDYLQRIQDARVAGNWLRVTYCYFLVLVVYLLGSLGLRLLGLLPIVLDVKKWKLREVSSAGVFLLSCGAASFLIPLLFNQGKKPFDIVQFTPYFTLLTGIGLTVFVFHIFKKPALVLVALIIIFILLDRNELVSRSMSLQKLPEDQVMIPVSVVQAANYAKYQTPSNAVFLIAPTEQNLGTLWFTSLTWRRAVYSGEFFPFQVGLDTVKGKDYLQKIFSDEFVEPKFDYVFLRRSETYEFGKIERKYNLRRVFENGEVVIWQRFI